MDNLHPVHATKDGIFNTFSGIKIDLHRPTIAMISDEDIAHALAHICRFGGHVRHFYSVAQHSILVMRLAREADENLQVQLACLVHDAAEAYLGDVISPLKHLLGDVYKKLEAEFTQVIAAKYGLDPALFAQVKYYDRLALEIEHEYFFKKEDDRFWAYCPGGAQDPNVAEVYFLNVLNRKRKEVMPCLK